MARLAFFLVLALTLWAIYTHGETQADDLTFSEGRCTVTWRGGPPYGDWLYELTCEPLPVAPQTVEIINRIAGTVTHYGPSYNGQPMGCTGAPYRSGDTTIIAVGPSRYREWPCGTRFRVTGPAGSIVGYRQDACPACWATNLDLSEAGAMVVCGFLPGWYECQVTIEVLR